MMISDCSIGGLNSISTDNKGDFLTELVGDIDGCLNDKRFATALSSALTVPDICSKLELRDIRGVRPSRIKQARYEFWFNSYVAPLYPSRGWPPNGGPYDEDEWPPWPGLSGADAYALRNSIIHGGNFETPSHASRPFLDGFIFVAPTAECRVHRCFNPLAKRAYLDAEMFTRDILAGFHQWEAIFAEDQAIWGRRESIAKLVRVGSFVELG